MLSISLATSIASLIGIDAIKAGSQVYVSNASLMIGEPCSGMRSLISLFALGVLVTHFTVFRTTLRKTLFII